MISSAPFPALSTIVFNDAFGCTRLTLPNKVKTVRNYSAAVQGALQQLTDQVVLSGIDYPSSSKFLSVPALKSSSIRHIHSYDYAFAADDTWVYRLIDWGKGPSRPSASPPRRSLSATWSAATPSSTAGRRIRSTRSPWRTWAHRSAKELDLRSFYARHVAQLRALAYACGGSLQQNKMWLKAKGRLSLRIRADSFGSGFLAACLSGVMNKSQVNYQLSRFGSTGDYSHPRAEVTAPITLEEVQAGLALLAEHGQSAFDLIGPIEGLLEKQPIEALFTPQAGTAVAQAIREAEAYAGPDLAPPYSFRLNNVRAFVLGKLDGEPGVEAKDIPTFAT